MRRLSRCLEALSLQVAFANGARPRHSGVVRPTRWAGADLRRGMAFPQRLARRLEHDGWALRAERDRSDVGPNVVERSHRGEGGHILAATFAGREIEQELDEADFRAPTQDRRWLPRDRAALRAPAAEDRVSRSDPSRPAPAPPASLARDRETRRARPPGYRGRCGRWW